MLFPCFRYDRVPQDFFSTLDFLCQASPSPSQPQQQQHSPLPTLARILHRKRWIWAAQSGIGYSAGLQEVARILSTITRSVCKLLVFFFVCWVSQVVGVKDWMAHWTHKGWSKSLFSWVVDFTTGSHDHFFHFFKQIFWPTFLCSQMPCVFSEKLYNELHFNCMEQSIESSVEIYQWWIFIFAWCHIMIQADRALIFVLHNDLLIFIINVWVKKNPRVMALTKDIVLLN